LFLISFEDIFSWLEGFSEEVENVFFQFAVKPKIKTVQYRIPFLIGQTQRNFSGKSRKFVSIFKTKLSVKLLI